MHLRAFRGDKAQFEALPEHAGPSGLSQTLRTEFGDLTVDTSLWREGDVLVTQPIEETASAKAIRSAQSLTPATAREHRWTHVALVGPDLLIWEAWPDNNVRCLTVREFLRDKEVVALVR